MNIIAQKSTLLSAIIPSLKAVAKGVSNPILETFMLKNGYSAKTENDTKSTVYSYVTSVKAVMSDEGLDWTSLVKNISSIASLYDIGGAKEEIGDRGNRTVINALRRFEDFVNNSTP